MNDLLKLWKTRRKVISQMDWESCPAVLYQLDKCILDLEMELEYESQIRRTSEGTTSVMERGNEG